VLHAGVQDADAQTTATDAAVRLRIRAGDQIGFRQFGSMPQAFNGSTLLVTGVIEPDADGDLYGDESQDACPNEASLHVAPCHADIALTMTGPAFAVLDRDTPYAVTVVNHGPSAAWPSPTRSRPGHGSCASTARAPAPPAPPCAARCPTSPPAPPAPSPSSSPAPPKGPA
jgi:hypothetical protein